MLFSLYLRAEKATKKRNQCDIYLRIAAEGKRTLVKTQIKLSPNHWDVSKQKVTNNHPDAYELNSELNACLLHAAEKYKLIKEKGKTVTLEQFKEILLEKKTISYDFVSFAEQILKGYLSRREGGTYNKNRSILTKIKDFAKSDCIPFQKIDVEFCRSYENFCKTKWNNKHSTIKNSIKFIRTVINQAIIEGHTDQNKTIGYKLPVESSERVFLTEEEVRAFELVKTNSSQDEQIKDMFLLASKYTGLRVSDLLLLKVKNIRDGQLSIRMRKTKKQLSFHLHPDAELILTKYCEGKGQNECVFTFKNSRYLGDDRLDPLEQQKIYKSTIAYYNKVVKKLAVRAGIRKHVTSHVGRHSFACYWVENIKNIYSLRDMLGHCSVRETEVYAKLVGQGLKDDINKLYPKSF
jgi:integrase/recombinase XerD